MEIHYYFLFFLPCIMCMSSDPESGLKKSEKPSSFNGRPKYKDYVNPHDMFNKARIKSENRHEEVKISSTDSIPYESSKAAQSQGSKTASDTKPQPEQTTTIVPLYAGRDTYPVHGTGYTRRDHTDVTAIFFKQYIQTLLNNVELLHSASDEILARIYVLLTKHDISVLETYAKDKGRVQDVSSILNNMIKSIELINIDDLPKPESLFQKCTWWLSEMRQHINILLMLILSTILVIALIRIQPMRNLTPRQFLTRLFIVLFTVSVGWNWWRLYQVEVSKRMIPLPDSCRSKEKEQFLTKFFDGFKSLFVFTEDPCTKYFERLYVSPALEVTPTQALAVTLTNFVVEPFQHVGLALKKFFVNLLQDLPFLWTMPVFVFAISLLFFLLLIFGGYRIVFFHFLRIEPGNNATQQELQFQLARNRALENQVQALEADRSQLQIQHSAARLSAIAAPSQPQLSYVGEPQRSLASRSTTEAILNSCEEVPRSDSAAVVSSRSDPQLVNHSRISPSEEKSLTLKIRQTCVGSEHLLNSESCGDSNVTVQGIEECNDRPNSKDTSGCNGLGETIEMNGIKKD